MSQQMKKKIQKNSEILDKYQSSYKKVTGLSKTKFTVYNVWKFLRSLLFCSKNYSKLYYLLCKLEYQMIGWIINIQAIIKQ